MTENEQVHPIFRRILESFKKGYLTEAETLDQLRQNGAFNADEAVPDGGSSSHSTGNDLQKV